MKFTHLTNLQLNLEDNDISDKGAECLFLALSKLNNLLSLQLNLCTKGYTSKSANFGEKGVTSLCTALIQLQNMKFLQLNLKNSKIGEMGISLLSSALS